MTANRLTARDCHLADGVADLLDAAVQMLRLMDMRHYYGAAKADTKGEVYAIDSELWELSTRLRTMTDASRERRRAEEGPPPLAPFTDQVAEERARAAEGLG